MIETSRRGARDRVAISTAATGSVGDTTAPSTNAAGHVIPSIRACATTATETIVAVTRPTASRPIGRMLARMSCSDAKKAAEYSSGGRNATRTISGSSSKSPPPGMKASRPPPIVSRIGYGMPVEFATSRKAPAPSRSARRTSSPCIRKERLWGGQGRHGERGDALAASYEAHALARGRLDVDARHVEVEPGGQRRGDRVARRGELGALHQDGRVDVLDPEALGAQE